MPSTPDRRRVARITFPRRLAGPELQLQLGRILDLSTEGARLEHAEPLREGMECVVDLPAAPDRMRLTARVIWTQPQAEQTSAGEHHRTYHTGVVFAGVTAAQIAVIDRLLKHINAERAGTELPDTGGGSRASG